MATQLCTVYKTVEYAIESLHMHLAQVGRSQADALNDTFVNTDDRFMINFKAGGKFKSLWFDKKRYSYNRIFIGKSRISFTYGENMQPNGLFRTRFQSNKLQTETFVNSYIEHVAHLGGNVEIMPTAYKTNTESVIKALEQHGFKLISKCKMGSYLFSK